MPKQSVAIIGAGLSAAVCAKALNGLVDSVSIFEQTDHVGGRLYLFDELSTTQTFTVSTPFFQQIVDRWTIEGLVTEKSVWHVEVAEGEIFNLDNNQTEYSVEPSMTTLVQNLLSDVNVQLNTEVSEIVRSGNKWRLFDFEGSYLGLFDCVILSAATTAQSDLIKHSSSVFNKLQTIQYSSCWNVVLKLHQNVKLPFDHATYMDEVLADSFQINEDTISLTANPEWSEKYSALSKMDVCKQLTDKFCHYTNTPVDLVISSKAKYWPHKSPINTMNEDCIFDHLTGFGACGDWCTAPRVEGAVLSGFSIADRVMKYLSQK